MSQEAGGFGFGARRTGPYGTNLGDIWSGEESEVGRMLLERDNLVMIHEMFADEETGKAEERIYCVKQDNPDMQMQDLIKRAREGTKRWVDAQARNN